jgi:hypothetical protein
VRAESQSRERLFAVILPREAVENRLVPLRIYFVNHAGATGKTAAIGSAIKVAAPIPDQGCLWQSAIRPVKCMQYRLVAVLVQLEDHAAIAGGAAERVSPVNGGAVKIPVLVAYQTAAR